MNEFSTKELNLIQCFKDQFRTLQISNSFTAYAGRRKPQYKTISVENDISARPPQWKGTSVEDNLSGKQP